MKINDEKIEESTRNNFNFNHHIKNYGNKSKRIYGQSSG